MLLSRKLLSHRACPPIIARKRNCSPNAEACERERKTKGTTRKQAALAVSSSHPSSRFAGSYDGPQIVSGGEKCRASFLSSPGLMREVNATPLRCCSWRAESLTAHQHPLLQHPPPPDRVTDVLIPSLPGSNAPLHPSCRYHSLPGCVSSRD